MCVVELHGVSVLMCEPVGGLVCNDRDAVDLMALARSRKATVVVLPVSRLHPDFFVLRTGVAGEIVQKFVMYRVPVVVLGDISGRLAASSTLRAFVYEANRGKDVWFVADESELDSRLLRVAI